MYNWQDYLAPQPVMYQPNAASTLTEVADNLKGVLPQSPTLSITPESWYFVKQRLSENDAGRHYREGRS